MPKIQEECYERFAHREHAEATKLVHEFVVKIAISPSIDLRGSILSPPRPVE
jgi:hypothetical protein